MRITKANKKAVDYACKKFHYAKSTPVVQYAYNIYNNNDEWCGVIVYSSGACPNIANQFSMAQGEVLELVRVALNGKQEYTSEAVSMSLRQLHRDNPLCRIVVSYADHNQRHIGTIYQATNWIYLGTIKRSDEQYFYKGNWRHYRSIGAMCNKDELVKTLPKRKNGNKFKYIYCLNRKDRKHYQKQALPYPKDKDLTSSDD